MLRGGERLEQSNRVHLSLARRSPSSVGAHLEHRLRRRARPRLARRGRFGLLLALTPLRRQRRRRLPRRAVRRRLRLEQRRRRRLAVRRRRRAARRELRLGLEESRLELRQLRALRKDNKGAHAK